MLEEREVVKAVRRIGSGDLVSAAPMLDPELVITYPVGQYVKGVEIDDQRFSPLFAFDTEAYATRYAPGPRGKLEFWKAKATGCRRAPNAICSPLGRALMLKQYWRRNTNGAILSIMLVDKLPGTVLVDSIKLVEPIVVHPAPLEGTYSPSVYSRIASRIYVEGEDIYGMKGYVRYNYVTKEYEFSRDTRFVEGFVVIVERIDFTVEDWG